MLAALRKKIVQFSKIISHDLQEPIRKIKLFANILESDENKDEKRSALALQRIQASADRLAQLTTGLQQYVNIDREGSPRQIDLNELVGVAMKNATRDRSFNALRIDSDPLPSIEGTRPNLNFCFITSLTTLSSFAMQVKIL
jgi:light-regulated signal transduction histidine kinase (bacteriophytochrome)